MYDLLTLSLHHGDKKKINKKQNKILQVLQHILLGVVISINLSWRPHIFKVCGKVLKEV